MYLPFCEYSIRYILSFKKARKSLLDWFYCYSQGTSRDDGTCTGYSDHRAIRSSLESTLTKDAKHPVLVALTYNQCHQFQKCSLFRYPTLYKLIGCFNHSDYPGCRQAEETVVARDLLWYCIKQPVRHVAQIISLTIMATTAYQCCHGNTHAFDGSRCLPCRCLFSS